MSLISIYRAYGGELEQKDFKPFRPSFFNKFKAWSSFYREFKDNKIIVVWDGDTNNELYSYISKFPVEIVLNEVPGNIPSLLKCYDIAEKENFEFIYCVEDDYIHLEGGNQILLDMFRFSPLVSLCDYQDRYRYPNDDVTFGQDYIIQGNFPNTYRTAESTTMTFGIKRDFLIREREIINFYVKKGDGAPADRELFRHYITKGIRLVTPIGKDSKAAHLVLGTMNKMVDWEKEMNWTSI